MKRSRVVPVLLLSRIGLIKTTKFASPKYIGDPINAVKIFNDKEADEIVLLDISATNSGKGPDFERIEEIASEAFMPLGYGGGISSIEQIERLFKIGIEKVIINSAIHTYRDLLRNAARTFGSQSVVASIDVRKNNFGRYRVYSQSGKRKERIELASLLARVQEQGAGEVIINSIDRDGTMTGFDIDLISTASRQLDVPLMALGGAGTLQHLDEAIRAGASSVAAGSMFVFHGRHRAVLISYIDSQDLASAQYGSH